MTNNYVIDVKNLNKFYGKNHVVNNVSLQVEKGEIFGFLGPNGSGKTTTIRMLCGLLTPDSGSGTCLGYDITNDSQIIKREIGYMTQQFSMWQDLTVRENLDFVARIYNLPNKNQAIDNALNNFGLHNFADHLSGSLSGGWRQRTALAACMIHNPKLLLLDEPTAGVDPKARRDFWEDLHTLAASGVSILVSTHYMDEAERCHKLAYILNGNLITYGRAKEIIEHEGLYTFLISGDNLTELSEQLRAMPGVEQTIVFGENLHLSGTNLKLLNKIVDDLQQNGKYNIEKISTSLEDVFIHLMKGPA
jgi:ABC-2 type transport system ATP-binding protein